MLIFAYIFAALKGRFSSDKKLGEWSKKFVMVNINVGDLPKDKQFSPDGDYVPKILFMGKKLYLFSGRPTNTISGTCVILSFNHIGSFLLENTLTALFFRYYVLLLSFCSSFLTSLLAAFLPSFLPPSTIAFFIFHLLRLLLYRRLYLL